MRTEYRLESVASSVDRPLTPEGLSVIHGPHGSLSMEPSSGTPDIRFTSSVGDVGKSTSSQRGLIHLDSRPS